MSNFSFQGAVGASKSLTNRAQIVRSYNQDIKIIGDSESDDVHLMKRALLDFKKGLKTFDCGEAGTVLRFLILRLSRERGEWHLTGSPRLFSRPVEGLTRLLMDLGVQVESSALGLRVISEGWSVPEHLQIDAKKSSQFATGLLLNAWNLPKDLCFSLTEQQVSGAYFRMTLKLVEHFGMQVQKPAPLEYVIPANTMPRTSEIVIEPDLSSCFALVACAALGGKMRIDNFPENSWQPDVFFLQLLKQMNIPFRQDQGQLVVDQTNGILPINCDLTNTPDLFPVLAVLLSQASGESRITGIEHLIYKESNRLENVIQLLKLLKRDCSYSNEHFKISGRSDPFSVVADFDPDQDHRMAMAAQAANFAGAQLNIKDKFVVKKSFPEFWQSVGEPCTP